MLFVAFGALVLVPLLTGLDPSIALFTAGAGTLVFHLITKKMIPIFLASSFAFIAPIQIGIKEFGVSDTLGGLACAGLVYVLLAGLIKLKGVEVIEKYLPPVITGPVIMVIGLNLAPSAVNMTKSFTGSGENDYLAMLVALITLCTTIIVVVYGKGLLKLIPIICGIIVGYVLSAILGVIDFTPVNNSSWFEIPWVRAVENGTYAFPGFNISAILFILPIAIAPAIEHVGDIVTISSVTGKDYLQNPGLHRTILGDGIATSLASLLGGPPNTTYSEVTGAVALIKVYDPLLMRIAALFAIVLAFFGKLNAILQTIPAPVMGGILIVLFGMIALVGVDTLIRNRVDFSNPRNLIICAVILVFGIGNMSIGVGKIMFSGIGLAGIAGIILNIIFPDKENTTKPD